MVGPPSEMAGGDHSSQETDQKILFRTAHPLPACGGDPGRPRNWGTEGPGEEAARMGVQQGPWSSLGGMGGLGLGRLEGKEAERRDYLGNRVGVGVGGGGSREKLLGRGGNGFWGRSWKSTKFLGSCPSPQHLELLQATVPVKCQAPPRRPPNITQESIIRRASGIIFPEDIFLKRGVIL